MPSSYEERQATRARKRAEHLLSIFSRSDIILAKLDEKDVVMISISIKLPKGEGESYRAIARGLVGSAPMVAFHNADNIQEAFAGLFQRLENHSIKWVMDKFATRNEGSP